MGVFATTTALQTLLPGVTFDTATTSLCTLCITWAEGLIRNNLAKRYNLAASPFNTSTTIPTQVTSITEKIAMGYYFKLSSRGAKESISRGDALITEGRREIEAISDYTTDLVDNSFALITQRQDEVIASTSAYHTTFDEDDPLDWLPDDDKLTDIETDRD